LAKEGTAPGSRGRGYDAAAAAAACKQRKEKKRKKKYEASIKKMNEMPHIKKS